MHENPVRFFSPLLLQFRSVFASHLHRSLAPKSRHSNSRYVELLLPRGAQLDMATTSDKNISGYIDSTVYTRNGKQYISREGKEIPIFEFQPEAFPVPLLLAYTGSSYLIVNHVPPTEAYGGSNPLERLSHDLSVFWSQLSAIKSSDFSSPQIVLNQLDELAHGVFEAMNAAGKAISEEQEKTRAALSEVESMQVENNKLKHELTAHSNAAGIKASAESLKKLLSRIDDASSHNIPRLHKACLVGDDISPAIGAMIQTFNWNIHEEANFCFVRDMAETQFQPIHIAALKGHIEIMKELYKLNRTVANSLTGKHRWTVLDCAAYSSVEAFELAKSWTESPQNRIMTSILNEDGWLLRIAAFGGNLRLLQLLLEDKPVPIHARPGLVLNALNGNHMDVLEWSISLWGPSPTWASREALADLIVQRKIFDNLEWLLVNAASPEILETADPLFNGQNSNLQNFLASRSLVEELKALSKIGNFNLSKADKEGRTLLHVACLVSSVAVLQWAFVELPHFREAFDIVDNDGYHLIHVAAAHGSLDCLKWICSTLPKFQFARGSAYFMQVKNYAGATALDLARDEAVSNWIQEVHVVD